MIPLFDEATRRILQVCGVLHDQGDALRNPASGLNRMSLEFLVHRGRQRYVVVDQRS